MGTLPAAVGDHLTRTVDPLLSRYPCGPCRHHRRDPEYNFHRCALANPLFPDARCEAFAGNDHD
ncbi:MAG: hypothetical protein JNM60_01025 [Candidatus Competibacteraceae bacterium]|nr:hypothetical protein [Candidatus Competibacteraceae bacterium]